MTTPINGALFAIYRTASGEQAQPAAIKSFETDAHSTAFQRRPIALKSELDRLGSRNAHRL